MKKIFLIIFVVIFISGSLLLYTNYKSDSNNINTGCLFLDFDDDEVVTVSHIYYFSNNTYERITKEDYEGILGYYPLNDGYFCIERKDIYGDEQRYIVLKTEDTSISISIDLTVGNISVKGSKIFYLADFYSTADDYELGFIDIGTNKQDTLNKRVLNYCLFDESIYYISENGLFSNNLDLNSERKINGENCKSICNSDNYIFFQTDDGIYKFDPAKDETTLFSNIKKYNVRAAINDDTIIISKEEKDHDQLTYSLFNAKKRYYILYSNGKKKEISELRGKWIETIRYYPDAA